jgi:antitoxin ParD1/3/4
MNIAITPEIERLVHGIFAGGGYATESEVVAAALQLLQQRNNLRTYLKQGAAELDRGERLDGDDVFSELRRRAAELDEYRA